MDVMRHPFLVYIYMFIIEELPLLLFPSQAVP